MSNDELWGIVSTWNKPTSTQLAAWRVSRLWVWEGKRWAVRAGSRKVQGTTSQRAEDQQELCPDTYRVQTSSCWWDHYLKSRRGMPKKVQLAIITADNSISSKHLEWKMTNWRAVTHQITQRKDPKRPSCCHATSHGSRVSRGTVPGMQNHPKPSKLMLTMSGTHVKMTNQAKEWENTTPNKKKSQSIKTDPKLAWVIELIGRKH